MQPPPEIERFNENYQLSEATSKNPIFKNHVLKAGALGQFGNASMKGASRKDESTRKSILQSIKNAKWRSEKLKLPDQSTVKTQEILKLINGVNKLSEKQD